MATERQYFQDPIEWPTDVPAGFCADPLEVCVCMCVYVCVFTLLCDLLPLFGVGRTAGHFHVVVCPVSCVYVCVCVIVLGVYSQRSTQRCICRLSRRRR